MCYRHTTLLFTGREERVRTTIADFMKVALTTMDGGNAGFAGAKTCLPIELPHGLVQVVRVELTTSAF